MALIPCPECGTEMSTSANACPKCGAAPKRIKWWLWGPLGLVVLFFGIGFTELNSPEGQEKAKARNGIRFCWDEHQRKSHDPATQRFVAATCEGMEAKFVSRFGVKP